MRRLILASMFAAFASVSADAMIVYNTTELGTFQVKSGTATPVRVIISCGPRTVVTGTPTTSPHGEVAFKEVERKGACGNELRPAFVIIYRSNPGYTGPDDVTFYSGPAPFHFKVNVESGGVVQPDAPQKPGRHGSQPRIGSGGRT